MKNIIFTLFALGLCFSSIQAQTDNKKSTPQSGPEITFEETTLDFGTIAHGSDGLREFRFTNTGNGPLVITKAKGSCGCTVPSHPKEAIQPGESNVIQVEYDTKRLGRFNKSVTVTSNTGTPVILRIKGEVKPAGEIEN